MVVFQVIGATIKLFAAIVIAALLVLLVVLFYFMAAVAGWIVLGFVIVVLIYIFLGELWDKVKSKARLKTFK